MTFLQMYGMGGILLVGWLVLNHSPFPLNQNFPVPLHIVNVKCPISLMSKEHLRQGKPAVFFLILPFYIWWWGSHFWIPPTLHSNRALNYIFRNHVYCLSSRGWSNPSSGFLWPGELTPTSRSVALWAFFQGKSQAGWARLVVRSSSPQVPFPCALFIIWIKKKEVSCAVENFQKILSPADVASVGQERGRMFCKEPSPKVNCYSEKKTINATIWKEFKY